MPPRLFVATKALINYEGKILVVRESADYEVTTNPGKYDVVGGRLEPGEQWNECLLREIKEEAGLTVEVGRPFFVNEWRPVVKGEQWQIVGIFFECFAKNDTVVLSQDHDAHLWIDPKTYKEQPIIENLHTVFEAYLTRH